MSDNTVNFYLAPNLPQNKHAFFGRCGGVSTGFYDSLNFNYYSNDKKENIKQNLEIVGKFYGLNHSNIMRPKQGHTNKAVYIDYPSFNQIEADGIITDHIDIILGITTADCMPVLLADFKHGIIGAAHAGWRGALSGIVENTISIMLDKGANKENIAVAIGPCLQQKNFEVHNDMRNLFLQQDKDNDRFFKSIDDQTFLCDLEGYMKQRLMLIGIKNISLSGIDTYSHPELYFSYRRYCHQDLIKQEKDFPIELSTIRL